MVCSRRQFVEWRTFPESHGLTLHAKLTHINESAQRRVAAAFDRSFATKAVGLVLCIAAIVGAYWLLTRVLGYDYVYANDTTFAAMLGVFIVVSLMPSAWRSTALLIATLGWHAVFTSAPIAAAIVGSSAGIYLAVRSARFTSLQRSLVIAPLLGVFVAAAWAESAKYAAELTLVARIYQFGWDVMILRMVYFIAEGPQIRRGVQGDRLDQFLVFLLFFPFTLYIVLMSYAEFLGSRKASQQSLSRVRGVQILLLAVFKYGAFVAIGALMTFMRQRQFEGDASAEQEALHLWVETMMPYVHGFCFVSVQFDLGTSWARLFGWNIESAFRWPLLARNMKDLWVRWNVYYRQALVNLFFYPFIRRLGDPANPLRHALALVSACVLTFTLSAGLHFVLYGWNPALAAGYFLLQSIPVCYVLVMEYARLQRARRLKRRRAEPDPLFTPLFIAMTIFYQALLHYCMAAETGGTVGQRFVALVSVPVQLLAPLWSVIGWTLVSVIVGVGIARAAHRRTSPTAPMPKFALVRAFLIAALIGLVTAAPMGSLGNVALNWARSQPIGGTWELNAGMAAARAGRMDDAIDRLRRAEAFESQAARAQEELIAVYMWQRNLSAAMDVAQRLVEAEPGNSAALNVLAEAALRQGRVNEAVAHLTAAFDSDPTSLPAARNLSRVLVQQRRLDEAVDVWKQCTKARPGDAMPIREFADILMNARQYAGAIQVLREGLTALPGIESLTVPLVLLLAASPDESLRDPALALELAFAMAQNRNSSNAMVQAALAAAQAANGHIEEAHQTAMSAKTVAIRTNDAAAERLLDAQISQFAAGQPWRLPE